jgi:hypothetical protein
MFEWSLFNLDCLCTKAGTFSLHLQGVWLYFSASAIEVDWSAVECGYELSSSAALVVLARGALTHSLSQSAFSLDGVYCSADSTYSAAKIIKFVTMVADYLAVEFVWRSSAVRHLAASISKWLTSSNLKDCSKLAQATADCRAAPFFESNVSTAAVSTSCTIFTVWVVEAAEKLSNPLVYLTAIVTENSLVNLDVDWIKHAAASQSVTPITIWIRGRLFGTLELSTAARLHHASLPKHLISAFTKLACVQFRRQLIAGKDSVLSIASWSNSR